MKKKKPHTYWDVMNYIFKASVALHDAKPDEALYYLAVATLRIEDVYPGAAAKLQQQLTEAKQAVDVMYPGDVT